MYTGHFAAAAALKATVPRAPSWALFTGAALLDLLWAPFMVVGLERWDSQIVQIGYSHSLSMALLWSGLFAAFFVRRGWAVVLAVAVAVFSHWVLDWPVHKPHLPLFPHSTVNFGMGLGQLPWGPGWWLELGVILAASAYYLRRSHRTVEFGRHAVTLCGVLVGLHVLRAMLGQ